MVRNHYNQQARLREFAREEGKHWKLTMVDLEKKRIGSRNVENAFYEEGLYSDELERELNRKVEAPGMRLFDRAYNALGFVLFTREELGIFKKYLLIQNYRNPNNMSHYSPDWEGDYLGYNKRYRNGNETYKEHVCNMMQEICDHSWEELKNSEIGEIRQNIFLTNFQSTMFVRTDLEFCINDLGLVTERHDYHFPDRESIKYHLRELCKIDGVNPKDEDIERHLDAHQYIDNYVFYPLSSNVGAVTVSSTWTSLFKKYEVFKTSIDELHVLQIVQKDPNDFKRIYENEGVCS